MAEEAEREVYYFGCWGAPGHYLWSAAARHVWRYHCTPWPLRELDGCLAGDPAREDPRCRGHWSSENQPEGVVRLHRRAGWTAIAFWDRSGDSRPGSNSVFITRGDITGEEILALFEQSFPSVWARITASFALVLQAPSAPALSA